MALPCKLRIKLSKVVANPRHELLLKSHTLLQQNRRSQLDWSIHRVIGVSNYLQSGQRFSFCCFRAADRKPGKLHLRKTRYLGDTAHGKSERVFIGDKAFGSRAREKSRKTSSAMMAIWLAEQIWFSCAISCALVKCPVGLFG